MIGQSAFRTVLPLHLLSLYIALHLYIALPLSSPSTPSCSSLSLCNATDHHTDRLIGYGEPTPEAVGDLREVVPHTGIHKVGAH